MSLPPPGLPTPGRTTGRPANRLEAADPEYAAITAALMAHLERCADCNYDRECFVCVAGFSDDEEAPHGCHCAEGGGGYGVRLSRLHTDRRLIAQTLAEQQDRRQAELYRMNGGIDV